MEIRAMAYPENFSLCIAIYPVHRSPPQHLFCTSPIPSAFILHVTHPLNMYSARRPSPRNPTRRVLDPVATSTTPQTQGSDGNLLSTNEVDSCSDSNDIIGNGNKSNVANGETVSASNSGSSFNTCSRSASASSSDTEDLASIEDDLCDAATDGRNAIQRDHSDADDDGDGDENERGGGCGGSVRPQSENSDPLTLSSLSINLPSTSHAHAGIATPEATSAAAAPPAPPS
jgi:hypothetical protein